MFYKQEWLSPHNTDDEVSNWRHSPIWLYLSQFCSNLSETYQERKLRMRAIGIRAQIVAKIEIDLFMTQSSSQKYENLGKMGIAYWKFFLNFLKNKEIRETNGGKSYLTACFYGNILIS